MTTKQGDLALLNHPVAQKLLHSTFPAHLAYVWTDGTPRVVPIWFHWTGQELVFGTPPDSPKMRALTTGVKVCITIDSCEAPSNVLTVRGTAKVELVDGVVPEYALAAERYYGPEQGKAWAGQVGHLFSHMTRIAVAPEWVGLLDFEQRFPSAIERAMASAAASK